MAVNLDNSDNNFQDGGVGVKSIIDSKLSALQTILFQLDPFRGGNLVECEQFDLGQLSGVTDPVGEFNKRGASQDLQR